MAVLALLSIILFAGSAYGAPSRIVGGTETTVEKYPGLVSLEVFTFNADIWAQNCVANILTTTYTLTAAQCFPDWFFNVAWYRIRAGSSIRNSGGSVHLGDAIIIHPRRNAWVSTEWDIALFRLSDPLVYSDAVQPVTIVPQGYMIPDDSPVVHVGWGHTAWETVSSTVLLETQVYTINNELCADRYINRNPNPRIVAENMICTGLLDIGGRGPCQGDSGGPVYFHNVLVGIVSWGHQCANETYPAVNTAVSFSTDWIVSVVE